MRERMLSLLAKIKERPEMYVGGSVEERDDQLRNLTWLLLGYQLAIRDNGLGASEDFLGEFSEFIASRHECSANRGPVAAVQEACSAPEEAWELFWVCVEAFSADS